MMRLAKGKRFTFAVLLVSAWTALQAQQPASAGAAGTTAGRGATARVNSPEVLPDNRVTFRLLAPKVAEVLVNLPEPQNAQLNRFYTVEWFREVSRRLTPTGLLSFQLRSSENYISAPASDGH
jgi:hypothetical protein